MLSRNDGEDIFMIYGNHRKLSFTYRLYKESKKLNTNLIFSGTQKEAF